VRTSWDLELETRSMGFEVVPAMLRWLPYHAYVMMPAHVLAPALRWAKLVTAWRDAGLEACDG
jgi:hypothetical protein